MYSIKYTPEVIYVQSVPSVKMSSLCTRGPCICSRSRCADVLWASVALLSLDCFHFFYFWFILFCLNSSILLPQRFCCFFHLKTFEIVFTGLSMYRLSGGEKRKIFVNSLSQGFKHILRIRENCTHSSNKGENCDIFISSTKNVNGFY